MNAWFGRIAEYAAAGAGSAWALIVAGLALPVLLLLVGLDATNFVISIVSLVLLILIQNTQNRDSLALETKLDELIKAIPEARNDYIAVDRLPETEIIELRDHD